MDATTTATRAEPTARQMRVHGFMLAHQAEHGMPPTLREIGERWGIRSPNGVMCHLKALLRAGWARRREHSARGWIAIDVGAEDRPCCPACGRPVDAQANQEGADGC